MNRYRIRQIIGVLLFPFTDPCIQSYDYMYERYEAYNKFMNLDLGRIGIEQDKLVCNGDYKKKTDELIDYLTTRNGNRIKSYDDILMLCELYYPVLDLKQTMDEVQKIKTQNRNYSDKRENIALFYLANLVRIAHSLLTYRDGTMAIRTWNNRPKNMEKDIFYSRHIFDKVELWNMLNRFIVPDVLIAIFAVESDLNENALYEQKPNISLADKLLTKILKSGLAENHLHFNAGFNYEAVWLNRMNLSVYERPIVSREIGIQEYPLFFAAVFRLLAAHYIETITMGQSALFLTWIETIEEGAFKDTIEALYTDSYEEKDINKTWQHLWNLLDLEKVRAEADYLLYAAYNSDIELKTSSEFILLFHCYKYIKERCWDSGFAVLFLQYLRIKNQFFQKMQQSYLIPGLRYFQKYFNQAKAFEVKVAGKSGLALDVFRAQAKITCLKKLEVRIAPDISQEMLDCFNYNQCKKRIKPQLCKQLYDFLYLYRKYILENIMGVRQSVSYLENERKLSLNSKFSFSETQKDIYQIYKDTIYKMSIPTLGIVFHFIKAENLDNISGYYCWRSVGDNSARCSGYKLFWRQMMVNIAMSIEEIRTEIPKINEYIVGVDAASDENAMEPWMFAPAYQLMRSKKIVKPIVKTRTYGKTRYYNVQNVGFTYHVGEDFRHLISGLRHIDEVVEEFYYKPGDRLGHAIALGINVRKWANENEVIPMPIREYLENLLWIWGKNTNDGIHLPIQLEVLEEKIMECAKQIYQNVNGLNVRLLYWAYKRKFSHQHKEILDKVLNRENGLPKKEDVNKSAEEPQNYCRYSREECGIFTPFWTEEKLLCANYCPVFEERGNAVQLVAIQENEIEAFEILQEHLMEKVAQKGIYIETNPTSNVTIGEFDNLLEHPIFRMNPLNPHNTGGHHVMVTVNSDDPAVFNTNVENELAYIYYALDRGGYDKEESLIWIDRVRQNGLDASFVQKVKTTRDLLEEVGGILDELRTLRDS